MITHALSSLIRAIDRSTSLEDTIYLKDEPRHITLISGATTARLTRKPRKSGKHKVEIQRKGVSSTGNIALEGRVEAEFFHAERPREIIVDYVRKFLEERNYQVESITSVTPDKREIAVSGSDGRLELLIRRNGKGWNVVLRDKDPDNPLVCSPNNQYVFALSNSVRYRKRADGLFERDLSSLPLKAHDEQEVSISRPNLFSLLKNLILYGGSENLRLIYGAEGRIRPFIHKTLHSIKSGFSNGVITLTSAGRQTRKLKDFSYYMGAAGITAAIAAILTEYRAQKRAFGMAEHMPDSRQAAISKQAGYKLVYELRGVRSWRNFENRLEALFQGTGVMDSYRARKSEIYRVVKSSKDRSRILEFLGISEKSSVLAQHKLSERDYEVVVRLIDGLRPLEIEQIVDVELRRFRDIRDAADEQGNPLNLFKDSSLAELERFITKVYPKRLVEKTFYTSANRDLAAKFKQAIRSPTEDEIGNVLKQGSRYLKGLAWRAYSCFCLTYLAGLAATYGDDVLPFEIPKETFLGYYFAFGAYVNYVTYGMSRIGTVVNLQGLIKELDRDPRINASDAWLECSSHQNKVMLGAQALGMAVGLIATMASDYFISKGDIATANALLFGVEVPAVLIRSSAQVNWVRFYNGLSDLYPAHK